MATILIVKTFDPKAPGSHAMRRAIIRDVLPAQRAAKDAAKRGDADAEDRAMRALESILRAYVTMPEDSDTTVEEEIARLSADDFDALVDTIMHQQSRSAAEGDGNGEGTQTIHPLKKSAPSTPSRGSRRFMARRRRG